MCGADDDLSLFVFLTRPYPIAVIVRWLGTFEAPAFLATWRWEREQNDDNGVVTVV